MVFKPEACTAGVTGAAHQQALPQGNSPLPLYPRQLQQGAQHSPAPQAQGSSTVADSSTLRAFQKGENEAGLTAGPVDRWQNALHAPDLQACLSAQNSAAEPCHQGAVAMAASRRNPELPGSAAYAEVTSGNCHQQAEALSADRSRTAHTEDAGAAAASSLSPSAKPATNACLGSAAANQAGSVNQPGMTQHQHQHAVWTEGSNANATRAVSMPPALPGLAGLSLLEATPLLQLINSLQAAGALAAPSSAVAHVETRDAPVAEEPVGDLLEMSSVQADTRKHQLQVCHTSLSAPSLGPWLV